MLPQDNIILQIALLPYIKKSLNYEYLHLPENLTKMPLYIRIIALSLNFSQPMGRQKIIFSHSSMRDSVC